VNVHVQTMKTVVVVTSIEGFWLHYFVHRCGLFVELR